MGEETDRISYCGLYCGDCVSAGGEIADLARDLRKKLRDKKFDKQAAFLSKFFKGLEHYDKCYAALGDMVRLRCNGCREGGGPPFCKMRKCCQEKAIEGCWECADYETCKKLDFLKPVHGDAHVKNLGLIKKKGKEAFVSGKRHW
jgi:hypothetical protein